jgi:hypothetical protein
MSSVDAEDLIARLSNGLAPADRAAFRRAAESALATSPQCSGEGSTYRVIAKLWRSYFHRRRTPVTQAGMHSAIGRRASSSPRTRPTAELVACPCPPRRMAYWAATRLESRREKVAQFFVE